MNNLQTENLSCGYGNLLVLKELTVAARPGEILVLLGPNGAGKTTLLRSLARLLRPSSGTVCLHEKDIWKTESRKYARQVAHTPQTERRDWPLTVQQSVRLGRAPHRGWFLPLLAADQQIVDRAMKDTGLNDLCDRSITTLSGGEWRRMIIARALAQEASVLLLDEPTAGLDLKYQVQVLRLVKDLAIKRNLIVVITLHDLNHASLYGDRLAILANRSLVSVGSAEEVLTADQIEKTFGLPVTVTRHPVYHTPLVAPLLSNSGPE